MTWVDDRVVAALEARYGRPREVALAAEFSADGFALLRRTMRHGRRHDATLFIRDARGLYAVIRKPVYPPGVFRPPSGGVERGEDFEAGARREAREETGLEVALESYVLRAHATFTCAGERERWTTHVFTARATGGVLDPIDRREIAEARWATADEMHGPLVDAMRASGLGGLAYRAALQVEVMREIDRLDAP